MKKLVLLSLMTFFVTMFTNGQIVPNNNNCIFCEENDLGEKSSAIGEKNENSGNLSLTVGSFNKIGYKVDLITLIGDNNTAVEK
jgi:histone acetyltransferase (RNA polymerase elongator complex component)